MEHKHVARIASRNQNDAVAISPQQIILCDIQCNIQV